MKRKKSLQVVLSVLLAIVFAFVGVGPMTVEVKAQNLTEISWEDFSGAEYGETYNAVDTFLTYSGSSLSETAFEDYIQFSAGSSMMYASNNAWHGIWLGVDEGGTFFVKGSSYMNNGAELNATCPASTFGLDTLADVKLKLRVELRNVSTDGTSAEVRVCVNDVEVVNAAVQRTDAGASTIGKNIVLCAVGKANAITIPEKPLTEITWEDFSGAEYGKTYNAVDTFLTYSGSSLSETAFEDYIQFSAGSSLMFGASNAWHGIWIGVDASGTFYVKGSGYVNGGAGVEYICPASTFDLDTLADVKLKLRVEMREVAADGTSVKLSVWVNDVQVCDKVVAQRFSSDYAVLSNHIVLCAVGVANPITIPQKDVITPPEEPVELTPITWADFSGAEYGKTYNAVDTFLTYSGSSLTETAFEDYIQFSAGSSLMYASNNAWHGIWLGVDDVGTFFVKGASYMNNGEPLNATCPASTFGLDTLADVKLKLRVELQNVSADGTSAEVRVCVNDVEVVDAIAQRTDAGASVIGNNIVLCAVGKANAITIPEQPLTEITWEDFSGAEYGKTYNAVDTFLTYSGSSLTETAFEDYIQFSAGSSLMFGASNAWHGIWIGVDDSGVFYVKGAGYVENGSNINYTCPAASLGLDTLADAKLKLRVEMREVAADGTSVKFSVWVNDVQVCDKVVAQRFSSDYAVLSNNIVLCAVGVANPITIPNECALSDNYFDLSKGTYLIPSGVTEVSEKTIENGVEKWSVLTVSEGDALNTTGDYKVVCTDGKINYVQEVILYTSGTSNLKTYMRTLKHVQGVQNDVYEKADVKMCDVNEDHDITPDDVMKIRDILIGLFS